jgi:hypothetical protein
MAEMPRLTGRGWKDERNGKTVYEISTHTEEDLFNKGKNVIWTPNYY